MTKKRELEGLEDIKIKEYITFPSKLMPCAAINTFVMQAKGKNMMPDIQDGDWVFCETNRNFREKDIVVLRRGKNFHLKYYRTIGKRVFYEDANKNVFNLKGYKPIAKMVSIYSKRY